MKGAFIHIKKINKYAACKYARSALCIIYISCFLLVNAAFVNLFYVNSENEAVVLDAAFEKELEAQGFPEDYKVLLRKFHTSYPNWEFKAMHIKADWNTVIANEMKPGRSCISINSAVSWRSVAPTAYNWTTDKWTLYDNNYWIDAKKEVVEFYMDPRNQLEYLSGPMQFELLTYIEENQTVSGIEGIIKNTFMYDTTTKKSKLFDYVDESGKTAQMSYAEAIMQAAKYANVSPYYLASSILIEVGRDGSNSVSGEYPYTVTYKGEEMSLKGYYNFYNIGAYSHDGRGAIANGLLWAKYGASTYTDEKRAEYKLPWTDPYRAIVGGAKWFANNYVAIGQNTLYLKKFDLVGDFYTHQYMTAVFAALNEGLTTYNTYVAAGTLSEKKTFVIPVYKNMPEIPVKAPVKSSKNPNNILSSLTVDSYELTPTFDMMSTGPYDIIVEPNTEYITINAKTVNAAATITGIGKIEVPKGGGTHIVKVTAENGDVKEYSISIAVKQDPSLPDKPTIISDKVNLGEDDVITSIPLSSTAKNLLDSITAEYCTLKFTDAKGTEKTGAVATGDKLVVIFKDEVYKTFTCVVKGDVSGDGKIDSADSLIITQHVLKLRTLKSVYFTAADINKDANINSADTLMAVQHILGIRKITV